MSEEHLRGRVEELNLQIALKEQTIITLRQQMSDMRKMYENMLRTAEAKNANS